MKTSDIIAETEIRKRIGPGEADRHVTTVDGHILCLGDDG